MLLTFQGDKNIEKVYWHFNCFLKWRDESLENRAKQMFNNSIAETMKMFNNARIQHKGTSKER
jgi:hypothetical protein